MHPRRVLIVSPHFPPVSAPDMHRVRLLLPFLRQQGWEAEVLTVDPASVAGVKDDWLCGGLPAHVPVHRVKGLGLGWSRLPGLGTLGFRALPALARAGDALLQRHRFDLVLFSTTVFEVHVLGPRWARRFGVPFVMDYQDPWVNDYYRLRPDIRPPGGRLKFGAVSWIHRRMERRVLGRCSGLISVSPEYPRQIAARYPELGELPALVQPFPGAKTDFDRVRGDNVAQPVFDAGDGLVHWVYAGAVVPGMLPAIRATFAAVLAQLPADALARLRIHFVGTNYALGARARPVVMPLAEAMGLSAIVTEQCHRLPYSMAIACLLQADAVLAFGSDDRGYAASKILPCLLARRPLLAIFHRDSPAFQLLSELGGATAIAFPDADASSSCVEQIGRRWIVEGGFRHVAPVDEAGLARHTDGEAARILCAFMNRFGARHG